MNHQLAILISLLIAPWTAAQEPTARVKAEQRLADLLAPGATIARDAHSSAPPPRKLPRWLTPPEVPLKSALLLPPAPPKPESPPVRPRLTPEEAPFVRGFHDPQTPTIIEMPTLPLIRLWSPDVNEPMPVPVQAAGVRDRASLADPSLDFSVAAAQAKLAPTRTATVPFQAQNLPDPFEHAQAARLRQPLEELADPPLTLRPLGSSR